MAKIIPAVIPESFEHLRKTLTFIGAYTKIVQVDIVDGTFVPSASWPYEAEGDPCDIEMFTKMFEIEVDLMIVNPEQTIDVYVDAGVTRVIVHVESTKHMERILDHRRSHTYELGLSVNNDTPLETLFPYVTEIDFVQLMGIAEIGSQGQPFDERVLERIAIMKAQYPELPVSVDGSVNKETLPQLAKAGADRFVSGSAILSSDDPAATFMSFEEIVSTT